MGNARGDPTGSGVVPTASRLATTPDTGSRRGHRSGRLLVVRGRDTAPGASRRLLRFHPAILGDGSEGFARPIAATTRFEPPALSLPVQLHDLHARVRWTDAGGQTGDLPTALGDPVGSGTRPPI